MSNQTGPAKGSESLREFAFDSALIDALPLALFCKDYGPAGDGVGIFVAWNQSAEELWGLKRDAVLGRSDYDFFPKNQADYFKEIDLKVVTGQSAHFIPEEPVDSPVLGRRFVRTWKVPVMQKSGTVSSRFLLGLSIDITQIKALERELDEQREKTVYAAKLGEMADGIAHEINNPLAVVSGQIAILKREFDAFAGSDTPQAERFAKGVRRIEDMTVRIAGIVGSLRKFARDATHDEHSPVEIIAIVNDAVAICGQQIKSRGVNLRLPTEAHCRVNANTVQVSQVVVNLLLNAQAAIKGQIDPWIEVAVEETPTQVRLSITDSGPGISEAMREKIFQPFFTTKPVGEGTGLGLSISVGIMKEHGGLLELDDRHPHTRFVLSFAKLN